ncbi:competence protein ComEA [Alteromonadaceae bacterium Bs31]|nr:competence protein ComEA [Alteromonadaceae bacterium Bs31]
MTSGHVESIFKSLNKHFVNLMLALSVVCLMGAAPLSLAAKDAAKKENAAVVASKVNINKANAETIAQVLTGVGASKAEAIVAYRNDHGRFKSVETLLEVKGIGEATLEKNKGKIVL